MKNVSTGGPIVNDIGAMDILKVANMDVFMLSDLSVFWDHDCRCTNRMTEHARISVGTLCGVCVNRSWLMDQPWMYANLATAITGSRPVEVT